MRFAHTLIISALLSGCAPAEQANDLERRLADAEQQIATLEGQAQGTSLMLGALSAELAGPALVDFSSQNFSVGHSIYGAYLIKPVRIEEAGAGYRVHFQVINATSLILTDAQIQVSWIDDGAKRVTETIPGNFAPGTARAVSITLTEATPAALRNMNVSAEFAGARFVMPQ